MLEVLEEDTTTKCSSIVPDCGIAGIEVGIEDVVSGVTGLLNGAGDAIGFRVC